MTKRPSFAEARIDVDAEGIEEQPAPEPDEPFRVLILGDFSGRANRKLRESSLSSRRPIEVDRDEFDQILAKLGVELHLPLAGDESPRVVLRIRQLDDLHPDRIFQQVDLFQALRRTRKELSDPATFEKAAAALQSPAPAASTPAAAPSDQGFSLDNILDQALEKTASRNAQPGTPGILHDDWDRFLYEIVAPHRVQGAPENQAALVAQVDAAIGAQMRAVLHNSDFQAVECAWRSVFFLTSRLETGAQLKLYLLDISKPELLAMLARSDDPRRTEIYRLLVEQSVGTPGAPRWAAILGNFTFDATVEDAVLFWRMGELARLAGAPFISAAGPSLLKCKSLAQTPDPDDWQNAADPEASQAWNDLRQLPEAGYLGLVLPRFLLRLPYGKKSEPVESFDFEEMPDLPVHEYYLWGNPAFACVCLLGQAFSQYGWEFRPGMINEVTNLPVHLYSHNGENLQKPCAEIQMTERIAERIMDQGIMPLATLYGSDAVRLVRFQSFADPPAALAGRWF